MDISETSDCITIVVSEETGKKSARELPEGIDPADKIVFMEKIKTELETRPEYRELAKRKEELSEKIRAAGNGKILLTERGTSFGYNNLVVDMRSIPIMREAGYPVIMDATHAVQLPGGQGTCSGGDRRHVPTLAKAAVVAGAHGVFLECHPDPDTALCDGPNSWPTAQLAPLLKELAALWELTYDR